MLRLTRRQRQGACNVTVPLRCVLAVTALKNFGHAEAEIEQRRKLQTVPAENYEPVVHE